MTQHSAFGPGREFDLIRGFVQTLPDHDAVWVGPGDDAAVLEDGWVVSTDASVEHVHFRRDWLSPQEIGYRAAAIALSDLAAMAAAPVALFTALVLPAADYGAVANELMAGVVRAGSLAGAALAGGDTTRTEGPLVIAVTVLGRSLHPVLRSGARPGDDLWVTGTLGGAAAAVAAWRAGQVPAAAARRAFAEPQPRVREALWLAQHIALHALIDLSDGLASDAAHIAASSNVNVRINAAALPVHVAARSSREPVRLALTGGDDYELCFAAPADSVAAARAQFEATFHLPLTRIGCVLEGSGSEIIDENGTPLEEPLKGYDHFGGRP